MILRQYLAEAEVRQHIPEEGDVFAIELEDGTLLETYIIAIDNDTILLDATPKMIDVLREWANLEGEASEVLLEGQFKEKMHQAAESMDLADFVERFGHLFSPGEAEEFWRAVNDTVHETMDECDYSDKEQHADAGEYDYEGDMAKDELHTIVRAARRLNGMLDDNENMPEWVQSKITKAADYIDTAADYIESNKQQDRGGDTLEESHMSEVDSIIQDVISGDLDAYDIMNNPTTPEERYVSALLQKEYENVSIDHRLHPDDDFEEILNIVVDNLKNDYGHPELDEAEYQGRKVPLGKPMRGDVKKFKVYVKDPKTGNVKKVNFGHGGTSARRAGQKTMKIKKSNPARRKSFRARHHCENPGPRTKARYWSCRAW